MRSVVHHLYDNEPYTFHGKECTVVRNCWWSNGYGSVYRGVQVRVRVRARDRKWVLFLLFSTLKSDEHLMWRCHALVAMWCVTYYGFHPAPTSPTPLVGDVTWGHEMT